MPALCRGWDLSRPLIPHHPVKHLICQREKSYKDQRNLVILKVQWYFELCLFMFPSKPYASLPQAEPKDPFTVWDLPLKKKKSCPKIEAHLTLQEPFQSSGTVIQDNVLRLVENHSSKLPNSPKSIQFGDQPVSIYLTLSDATLTV